MTELGSGVSLDEDLDFSVGSTGDLKGVEGQEELAKDISFQLIIALQGVLGSVLTPAVEREIRDTTRSVALADPRVKSASANSIQVFENARDSFKISMSVVTTEGPQDLVFQL